MISIKPTKHLTGVTIQGEFSDFYELVDSMYRMFFREEDTTDPYFGVINRVLGICYDIRHAYMGDRDITLEENGISKELMKWHNIITATKNVYYSVNILFPEAIFLAAAIPQAYILSFKYYGRRGKGRNKDEFLPSFLYTDYKRDKANIDVFCAAVWQALGEAIGEEETEKIIRLMERNCEDYEDYAIHYIDKCNIELIKTSYEKRKDKLRNIAKRIVKKSDGYNSMENDLNYWAREYKTSIYDLRSPDLEYLEDIEW